METNFLPAFIKSIFIDSPNYTFKNLEDSIDYLLYSGLGPVVDYYTIGDDSRIDESLNVALKSSGLTSKILTKNNLDVLVGIAQYDSEVAEDLLLLKGVSVSTRYYPKPHLRTMGDIDLFITKEKETRLENILFEMGFQQKSEHNLPHEFYQNMHHSMPFFHPKKNIWIEIHSALFPKSSSICKEEVFEVPRIYNLSSLRKFNNYSFRYLNKEIELIYISAHWAVEHNWMKGLMRVMDILYILNDSQSDFDWNKLIGHLKNSPLTASYVYLIISYLKYNGYTHIPEETLLSLKKIQYKFNYFSLNILHALINNFLMKGNKFGSVLTRNIANIVWITLVHGERGSTVSLLRVPWNIVFIPNNKNRYSLKTLVSRIKKIF